ncbi:MAG: GNAT family N-acetyltransferase [Pseudomonadota bacterium]
MTERPTSDVQLVSGDPADGAFIEKALLKSLRSELPQSTNTSFVLSLKDPVGTIVGGLTASTSYGWLLIKVLWVEEGHRGLGFGRQLVAEAERRASDADCHSAWLDTSNPDAMRFYLSLGYTVFGELNNTGNQAPQGHARWFLKKPLDRDDRSITHA